MTSIRRFGWLAIALLALVGCESSTTPVNTPPAPAPGTGPVIKELPVEPKKEADAGKLSNDEIAEIKKLPDAEQPIALAQMTCPVSDEHLGEMGMPIKQTIGDKTFYICCPSCEPKVKSDPQGVLAKLKK
jgi:hypothetical protein